MNARIDWGTSVATGIFLIGCFGRAVAGGLPCDQVNAFVKANPSLAYSEYDSYPYCSPNGSPVMHYQQTTATVSFLAQSISSMASRGEFFSTDGAPFIVGQSGFRGMAAGGAGSKWSLWGNAARNGIDFRDHGMKHDGHVNNLILGADYRLLHNTSLGLSLAIDNGDISTKFNGGRIDTRNTAVAAYLSHSINRNLAVDAMFGFGNGRYDQSIGGITGDTDVDRKFFAANMAYQHWFGSTVQLLGKAGILHAAEKKGGFLFGGGRQPGADNEMDQLRLTARIGYWAVNGIMPYASMSYVNDMGSVESPGRVHLDNSGVSFSLGADFFSKQGITGGVAYNSREYGRRAARNDSFVLNIGMRF